MSQLKGIQGLQVWAQKVTRGYSNVRIGNMTTSWRNGLAFCAILHKFHPDLVDYNSLSEENVLQNNRMAFSLLEAHCGIPALLDAEDMLIPVPDRLSVITYVAQLYHYFKDRSDVLSPDVPRRTEVLSSPSPVSVARKRVLVDGNSRVDGKGTENGKESAIVAVKRPASSPCSICEKPVYILQRLIINDKLIHRTCFCCKICGKQLKVGLYRQVTDVDTEESYFECISHELDKPPPTAAALVIENKLNSLLYTDLKATESSQSTTSQQQPILYDTSPSRLQDDVLPTADLQRTSTSTVVDDSADVFPLIQNTDGLNVPIAPPRKKRQSNASSLASSLESIPVSVANEAETATVPRPTPRTRLSKAGITSRRELDKRKKPEVPPKPVMMRNGGWSDNPRYAQSMFVEIPEGTQLNSTPSPTPSYPGQLNPFGTESEESLTTGTKDDKPLFRQLSKSSSSPRPTSAPPPPPHLPTPGQSSGKAPVKPARVASYDKLMNPFASDSDDDDESDVTSSLNPFHSDYDDEFDDKPPSRLSEFSRDTFSSSGRKKRPAPLPPTPSTSTTKLLLSDPGRSKKRPAPPRPVPVKRQVHVDNECLTPEQILKELEHLDDQQSELEQKSLEVETALRAGGCDVLDTSMENEITLADWFDLIAKKNELVRREAELVFMSRENHLNKLHSDIEFKLRCIMEKPECEKTLQEQQDETELLQRLLEIVNDKSKLVDSRDDERIRQNAEDKGSELLNSKLETMHLGAMAEVDKKKSKEMKKKKKIKKRLKFLRKRLADNKGSTLVAQT